MSAQIDYDDEDEAYESKEASLQYYLNMFLDDEYHKDFRQYLKLSGEFDLVITEKKVFQLVDEFKDYVRIVNTDFEDLFMTADY